MKVHFTQRPKQSQFRKIDQQQIGAISKMGKNQHLGNAIVKDILCLGMNSSTKVSLSLQETLAFFSTMPLLQRWKQRV